jgi:DNA-directed RNA polymerase specialized sigma24 family protein
MPESNPIIGPRKGECPPCPADAADTFARFYTDSKDAVYRAVLLARRDPGRAEDAVQEAFARAYVRWDRVRSHPNPVGWVARVALNESASIARVLRRERPDPPDLPIPAAEPPPDAGLIRLVWGLPRRQRQVIALRVLLELSTEESAQVLGISAGTVTAHLHRALGSLRDRIDEQTREPQ